MANVLFRRGTQAELQALVSASKIKDGAFYLTTDTHRLYSGSGAAKIDLLSQAVITVSKLDDLNNNSSYAKVAGQFYYSVSENVLCMYSEKDAAYIQINPDSYTYVDSVDTVVTAVGDNGATLATRVTVDGHGTAVTEHVGTKTDATPVKLIGSGSAKVTVTPASGDNGPTITIDGIVYSIAAAALDASDEDNTGAKLQVGNGTVNVTGTGATKVNVKNGNVEISSPVIDYSIESVTGAAKTGTNATGFGITVKNNVNSATGYIDPAIKLGTNDTEYKFADGVATLPVYTKSEVDNKLNVANAMTYRGIITSDDGTTPDGSDGSLHIGDVFKIAGFAVDVKNRNGETEIAHVGDVIIANGTEFVTNANSALIGTIDPTTLYWDVVHAGDFSTLEKKYALKEVANGFALDKDGGNQGEIHFAGDAYIEVIRNVVQSFADSNGNGASVNFTVSHKKLTRTDLPDAEAVTQTKGGSASLTAIVDVDLDEAGHLKGVKKQSISVVDTTLDPESGSVTNTVTATADATNSVGVKTAISVKDTSNATVSKNDTFTIASPNNSIAVGASGKSVTIDLVWGSFTEE